MGVESKMLKKQKNEITFDFGGGEATQEQDTKFSADKSDRKLLYPKGLRCLDCVSDKMGGCDQYKLCMQNGIQLFKLFNKKN